MKNTASLTIVFFSIALIFLNTSVANTKITKKSGNHFANKMSLVNDYSFSQSTGTYTDLVGSTSINNNQLWDDPIYTIPTGFNFQLFTYTMDSIYFGNGVGGTVTTPIDPNFNSDFYIFPFETDLIDRGDISGISQSPISYKLEGLVGSRILKIEWKNAGFYAEGDVLGTLNDFINLQLWLYEGTNNIEFHYGSSLISNAGVNYEGETGALIGLSSDLGVDAYFLSGIPSSAAVVDSVVFINGTPANGTIYKFTKLSTGVKSTATNEVSAAVFPNPISASSLLKVNGIKLSNADLIISDVLGRTVYTKKTIQSNQIELSELKLQTGIYYYMLSENGKIIAKGKMTKE